MTLSPFVSIACDDLTLLDLGDESDIDDEADDGYPDKTGFNQNELVSVNRKIQAVNERPLCAFEKFVFTSGMEEMQTR